MDRTNYDSEPSEEEREERHAIEKARAIVGKMMDERPGQLPEVLRIRGLNRWRRDPRYDQRSFNLYDEYALYILEQLPREVEWAFWTWEANCRLEWDEFRAQPIPLSDPVLRWGKERADALRLLHAHAHEAAQPTTRWQWWLWNEIDIHNGLVYPNDLPPREREREEADREWLRAHEPKPRRGRRGRVRTKYEYDQRSGELLEKPIVVSGGKQTYLERPVRESIERAAAEAGYSFENFARPLGRGRRREAEIQRRDALAGVVHALVEQGVTLAAIGGALGAWANVKQVARLRERGAELSTNERAEAGSC